MRDSPSDSRFGPPDRGVIDLEERTELAPLARAALWACLAVATALAAAFAARSDIGSHRLAAALDGFSGAAQTAAAAVPSAVEAEIRRLTETVNALAADRDRLIARVAMLERKAEATGSIGRPDERAMPSPRESGPPAARPAERAEPASEPAVSRTEFGIDLGTGTGFEALRNLWSTVKAQHGALLDGLHPVVALRDQAPSGTLELRLVAGPLVNAAAAARLCAVISVTGRPCRPATFDGQRLALR